jgi:hypothetical protein
MDVAVATLSQRAEKVATFPGVRIGGLTFPDRPPNYQDSHFEAMQLVDWAACQGRTPIADRRQALAPPGKIHLTLTSVSTAGPLTLDHAGLGTTAEAAGSLVLLLLGGTARTPFCEVFRSTSSPSSAYTVTPSPDALVFRERPLVQARTRPDPSQRARLRVQRFAAIQSAFAFPMRVLADVLQRSPTQLYKWLDVNEEIDLNYISEKRVNSLERLAELWTKGSSSPLGQARKSVSKDGRSALDLLKADNIDEQAVENLFKQLVNDRAITDKTISQRMREKGFRRTRRPLPDDE